MSEVGQSREAAARVNDGRRSGDERPRSSGK